MKREKKNPCQVWVVVRNKHGEILPLYIAIPYFINSTEHTLLYYELQRKEKGRKGEKRERANEKEKPINCKIPLSVKYIQILTM